jgi:signal transduction histidine kinase
MAEVDPGGIADGITRRVVRGHELVIFTGDKPGLGRVSAVDDLSSREQEEPPLRVALAVAWLVGSAGAVLVGLVIARQAVRPLGEAMAMQRRFVTNASHELRSPLTVLHLRAQVLSSHLPPGTPADFEAGMQRLVRDSEAAGEVVTDLLRSAQFEARPSVGQSVDLWRLVRDVVQSLGPLADRRGVLLTDERTDAVHRSGAHTRGASAALRRAVLALVDNAVAHSEPGGRVTVRVDVRRDQVAVSVQDDGLGIDLNQAEQLFSRFRRGTSEGEGMRFGLGLALVDEVARAHGGTVEVENQPGSGAAFTLLLPRS